MMASTIGRAPMDASAAPFEPLDAGGGFADTDEPLRVAEQTAHDARAARLAAFYSDTETESEGSTDQSDAVDGIWEPQVWSPPTEGGGTEQTSPDGWGSSDAVAIGNGGWGWGGGAASTAAAAEAGAWAKGIGSPPSPHVDLTARGWDAPRPPSARILGYEGERVEAGLPPPLSAARCWAELDSPERAAAVALLGSTEDSWDADHAAASGARVQQRLETIRMQIGLNLQPAWWEAMGGAGSEDSPSEKARVRRVRIGEEGHTPREVREIELTPLSVRRQQMWRPNWNHSDSDEDDSDDSSDATDLVGAAADDADSPPAPAVPDAASSRASTAAGAATDGASAQRPAMDKASGRLGRLRSYEFGEYQLAQEAQQRRRGKKKYQDDDHASGGGGDLPLSPPGWKDLATAGWERKQKHKQKYRAARAVTKMEAAAATAAVNLSGGDGDGDGEGGGGGGGAGGEPHPSAAGRRRKVHAATDRRGGMGQGGAKGRRHSPGTRRDGGGGGSGGGGGGGGGGRHEGRRRSSPIKEQQAARYDAHQEQQEQERRQQEGGGARRGGSLPSEHDGSGGGVDAGAGPVDGGGASSELGVVQAQIAELKAELNLA
jgi:hypothetical protein